MQTTLTQAFTYLLSNEKRNFYARIVSSLIRIEKPGMGTIGVGPSIDGKNCLYYDPLFLEKMPLPEFVLTCEHEVLHLLLGHIPRYLNQISYLIESNAKQQYRTVNNIAADCAANELIRASPDFEAEKGVWFYGSEKTEGRSFLIPEQFNLPRNKPYEVYFYTLQKQLDCASAALRQKIKAALSGDTAPGSLLQGLEQVFTQKTAGSHTLWDHVVAENALHADELQGLADKLQQDARNTISKAVVAQNKNHGSLPSHLKELIAHFLAEPSIPWPRVLRQLCLRTRQVKTERGMHRPSRRLHGVPSILPFPGKAKDRRFTIAFALDTSGSMSRADLAQGLTEILNIVRTEKDVTLVVMYCDATLHITYNVTEVHQVDFNIVGRGGTDFNPPFAKVRQLLQTDRAPDILIYATDGLAPEPCTENRVPIPVIWLLTPNGRVPSPTYGIPLHMKEQR